MRTTNREAIIRITMRTVLTALLLVAPASAAENVLPASESVAASAPATVEPPATLTVPGTVPFQGFLTDGGGMPLDGTVDLQLRLWDVAAGGAPLWTEAHIGVSVSQGVFDVRLGSETPLPAGIFDGSDRYLGVEVDGGGELSPRTLLGTTPYAFHADDADQLEGLPAGAFLQAAGDTATGVITLRGGVAAERCGPAELVSGSELVRRYYFDNHGGSWTGRKLRLILSFGGSGPSGAPTGGSGTVTIAASGSAPVDIDIPAGGGRPWTYYHDIPNVVDTGTLDVTVTADSPASPVLIRSITLETDETSVEEPGPPFVAFHAYNSSTDAALAAGWNKVEGNVELFDQGNDYDTTLDRFTAPETGIYHFTQQVTLNDVDDLARYVTGLYVNGVQRIYTSSGYQHTTASFQAFGGSVTLALNAGDYVESFAYTTDASHAHYGGTNYTWFSGHQLTATTTAATRPVIEQQWDPEDESRP
jgi:hypothetical protein